MKGKRGSLLDQGGGRSYRVGVGHWQDSGPGETDASIFHGLELLGHEPVYFSIPRGPVPDCELLFLQGPRGPFLQVLSGLPAGGRRPAVIFWNSQGLPDLRIPWPLMCALSRLRLKISDLASSRHPAVQKLHGTSALRLLDRGLIRFHFLGQFLRSVDNGWIDLLCDISRVYAKSLSSLPVPVVSVPYGSMPGSYEDAGLERDIDVLWIGKRASRRRSRLIDRIRGQLQRRGVRLHVVDNEENPFVFGRERTRLLNRTKITLNLLRTWYDENSMRFCLAAPNRSLIVSEPLLAHVPDWEPGRHYVAAPPEALVETICHYLSREEERRRIVGNAYQLATTRLTFPESIRAIMTEFEKVTSGAERRDSSSPPAGDRRQGPSHGTS